MSIAFYPLAAFLFRLPLLIIYILYIMFNCKSAVWAFRLIRKWWADISTCCECFCSERIASLLPRIYGRRYCSGSQGFSGYPVKLMKALHEAGFDMLGVAK